MGNKTSSSSSSSRTATVAGAPPLEEERELGRGGFGRVALVRDRVTGQRFAVKTVPYGFATPSTEQTARNEAVVLQTLRHPNVVHLVRCWNTPGVLWGGKLFIQMEYCEQGSLRDLCRARRARGKPLTNDEIIHILRDLVDALQFVHQHGVLHRDVKMDNVLIDANGCIKLGDFGIAFIRHQYTVARTANNAATEASRSGPAGEEAPKTFLGTIGYMAPEMGTGQAYGKEVDVYALGCLLEEMTTLHFLYEPPVHQWPPIAHLLVMETIAVTVALAAVRVFPVGPLFMLSMVAGVSAKTMPRAWLYTLSQWMQAIAPLNRPSLKTVRWQLDSMRHWYFIASAVSVAAMSLQVIATLVTMK